jgi:cytochrome c-type biogenesis protein CcmH
VTLTLRTTETQRHREIGVVCSADLQAGLSISKLPGWSPALQPEALVRALRALVLSVSLCLCGLPASAVTPDERLADPALEARARAIGQELRCLVCQNQSIDDSNADLAHDLRVLVRERLAKGDSDNQVVDYVSSRYGDYVLLRPPVKPGTWALWFGPPALLLLGAAGVVLFFRRRRTAVSAPPPLSDDEKRRLDLLLEEGKG